MLFVPSFLLFLTLKERIALFPFLIFCLSFPALILAIYFSPILALFSLFHLFVHSPFLILSLSLFLTLLNPIFHCYQYIYLFSLSNYVSLSYSFSFSLVYRYVFLSLSLLPLSVYSNSFISAIFFVLFSLCNSFAYFHSPTLLSGSFLSFEILSRLVALVHILIVLLYRSLTHYSCVVSRLCFFVDFLNF